MDLINCYNSDEEEISEEEEIQTSNSTDKSISYSPLSNSSYEDMILTQCFSDHKLLINNISTSQNMHFNVDRNVDSLDNVKSNNIKDFNENNSEEMNFTQVLFDDNDDFCLNEKPNLIIESKSSDNYSEIISNELLKNSEIKTVNFDQNNNNNEILNSISNNVEFLSKQDTKRSKLDDLKECNDKFSAELDINECLATDKNDSYSWNHNTLIEPNSPDNYSNLIKIHENSSLLKNSTILNKNFDKNYNTDVVNTNILSNLQNFKNFIHAKGSNIVPIEELDLLSENKSTIINNSSDSCSNSNKVNKLSSPKNVEIELKTNFNHKEVLNIDTFNNCIGFKADQINPEITEVIEMEDSEINDDKIELNQIVNDIISETLNDDSTPENLNSKENLCSKDKKKNLETLSEYFNTDALNGNVDNSFVIETKEETENNLCKLLKNQNEVTLEEQSINRQVIIEKIIEKQSDELLDKKSKSNYDFHLQYQTKGEIIESVNQYDKSPNFELNEMEERSEKENSGDESFNLQNLSIHDKQEFTFDETEVRNVEKQKECNETYQFKLQENIPWSEENNEDGKTLNSQNLIQNEKAKIIFDELEVISEEKQKGCNKPSLKPLEIESDSELQNNRERKIKNKTFNLENTTPIEMREIAFDELDAKPELAMKISYNQNGEDLKNLKSPEVQKIVFNQMNVQFDLDLKNEQEYNESCDLAEVKSPELPEIRFHWETETDVINLEQNTNRNNCNKTYDLDISQSEELQNIVIELENEFSSSDTELSTKKQKHNLSSFESQILEKNNIKIQNELDSSGSIPENTHTKKELHGLENSKTQEIIKTITGNLNGFSYQRDTKNTNYSNIKLHTNENPSMNSCSEFKLRNINNKRSLRKIKSEINLCSKSCCKSVNNTREYCIETHTIKKLKLSERKTSKSISTQCNLLEEKITIDTATQTIEKSPQKTVIYLETETEDKGIIFEEEIKRIPRKSIRLGLSKKRKYSNKLY